MYIEKNKKKQSWCFFQVFLFHHVGHFLFLFVPFFATSPMDHPSLLFLPPPGAYFETFPAGEAVLLQEIGRHARPPPVPLVAALAAGFHQDRLHGLDHLDDGEQGGVAQGELLGRKRLARVRVLALAFPSDLPEGDGDPSAADALEAVCFRGEGHADGGAGHRAEFAPFKGAFHPRVVVLQVFVLRFGKWCRRRDRVGRRGIGLPLVFLCEPWGGSRIGKKRSEHMVGIPHFEDSPAFENAQRLAEQVGLLGGRGLTESRVLDEDEIKMLVGKREAGFAEVVPFELPIHAPLAQIGGQRGDIDARERDVLVAVAREVFMTCARPQPRPACQFQNPLGRVLLELRRTERRPEDSDERHGA